MMLLGDNEEFDMVRGTCDGRCTNGQWCVFQEIKEVCPVNNHELELEIRTGIPKSGIPYSVLEIR